jgi:hypothetical protein
MCVSFLVQYIKLFYKCRYLTQITYNYLFHCVNCVTLTITPITGLQLGFGLGQGLDNWRIEQNHSKYHSCNIYSHYFEQLFSVSFRREVVFPTHTKPAYVIYAVKK